MKKLFPSLCISVLFCSVRFYGVEEYPFEEINRLEPRLFDQQPISQKELDLSSLTFTPSKSSFLTVSLSSLFPGLGHAYLGDFKTAGTLFGSSGLFISLSSLKNSNESFRDSNSNMLQNTWLYGIYAAYRDVRAYNNNRDYSYKMPTESFADLAYAPFQWSVLKKPEVWGGFLGALTLGVGLHYLLFSEDTAIHAKHSSKRIFPLLAFPVGIGEESFFRGYLQSHLSEIATPWGGILISSLAFGAAHITNVFLLESQERRRYFSFSLPFITSFGVYFGWLAYKNCSLKEGVALHAWYDFALFLASYSVTQSIAIRSPSFAISIPF